MSLEDKLTCKGFLEEAVVSRKCPSFFIQNIEYFVRVFCSSSLGMPTVNLTSSR